MNATIIALVLGAALLHATWNALLKAGGDRLRSITLMTVAAGLACVPAVCVLPGLPGAVWGFVVASALLHLGYNLLLAHAYAHGDLGQVYPIARGSSPLLVTGGAALLAAEQPSLAVLLGVLLVSAGILGLARGWAGASRMGLLTAFGTGAFIAGYTITDALGARAAGEALSYACWLFVLDGVVMALVFLAWRGRRARLLAADAETAKAAAGGVVSVLAYGIVIWAASIGPMGPVSALRETSVVDAALIGRLFLGERLSLSRIACCGLVALGAVVLGLHA